MSLLDVVVVLVVLVQVLVGLRQGFVLGAFSIAGTVLGAVVGVEFLPRVLGYLPGGDGSHPLVRSAVAVVGVLVVAGLGRLIGSALGSRLRVRRAGALRSLDRLGGAVLSGAGTLVVLWAVGLVLAASSVPVLSGAARGSTVLARVDGAVPTPARDWVNQLSRQVDGGTYPALLAPFLSTEIPDVAAPDPSVADSGVARRAAAATVKVTGAAPSCRQGIEGSGFVVDATHVVTNAHVVAGVPAPTVALDGVTGAGAGRRYPARVVAFDPELDVAVLALVRGTLPVAPLRLAGGGLDRGTSAVVLGYPGDGPLTASAARVRAQQTITGTDIRGQGVVRREVYTLRTVVRPGNSGGPVVTTAGTVGGLVFAMSRDDPDTGYALTADQIAPTVRAGRSRDARAAVSTGACA